MAASRIARGAPPKRANAAFQPLERESASPRGLRLALARLGGSDTRKIRWNEVLGSPVLSKAGLIALFALLIACPGQAAEDITLTAEQARERLQQTGELRRAIVSGPFDLARLDDPLAGQSPTAGYRIEDVTFVGPVELVGQALGSAIRIERVRFRNLVRLEGCALQSFTARESIWAGDLVVEGCDFGVSRFDGNDFQADVRFHLAQFQHRPSFADSVFRGRTEFLECQFGREDPGTRATSFSDTRFDRQASFNKSHFHTRAKFQSAIFAGDASFLHVAMEGGASFRNVHFKGDAEFRFCRIASADFGNRDNLTLFAKRADFRGCEIERALFDYTEFRGEASFVNLRLGPGGASFRDAYLGDDRTDFNGLGSAGPLVLTNSHFPALHFHWRELRDPLLAAHPDSKVLAALHGRLQALGDTAGALDAGFYLAQRRFEERIALPLPSPTREPLGFLDAAGQRLIDYGEWLLWGLPTGYGTRLGRILLIALACWLLSALPLAAAGGILARVPAESIRKPETDSGQPARIFDPLPPEDLIHEPRFPASLLARLRLALMFTWRVLFKIGPKDVRYLTTQSLQAHKDPWRTYFAALWYLGSGLMLLTALTLANTSPIIEKLVGELLA